MKHHRGSWWCGATITVREHRRGAVANIGIFDFAEPFIGKTDFCAVAQDSLSSEFSADQKTQIVAYD